MNIDWKNWPIARIFKLIFTIGFVVLALSGKDWFFLIPAVYFGLQVIYNTGCGCSSQACEINSSVNTDTSKEI